MAIYISQECFWHQVTQNILWWLKQIKTIQTYKDYRYYQYQFSSSLISAKADITVILLASHAWSCAVVIQLSHTNSSLKKEKEQCHLCPFPFVRRDQDFPESPRRLCLVDIVTPDSYDPSLQQGRLLQKAGNSYHSQLRSAMIQNQAHLRRKNYT